MASNPKRRKVQLRSRRHSPKRTSQPVLSADQHIMVEEAVKEEDVDELSSYDMLLASIPKSTMKKYVYQERSRKVKSKDKDNYLGDLPTLQTSSNHSRSADAIHDGSDDNADEEEKEEDYSDGDDDRDSIDGDDEDVDDDVEKVGEKSENNHDQLLSDSDEETAVGGDKDPFKLHMDHMLSDEDVQTLNQKPTFSSGQEVAGFGLASSHQFFKLNRPEVDSEDNLEKLHVKSRICKRWAVVNKNFTTCQQLLFKSFNRYQDVLYTRRGIDNGEEIRKVYALHALNHVLKSRGKVLKNNARIRLARQERKEIGEHRDQGFTRPKVLILVPFREAALRTVNVLISLLLAEGEGQVANRRRFLQEFSDDNKYLQPKIPKPASYKAMFEGNIDDCFRFGMSVKGKQIKLYTDFYSSDIIIASPLGLRTVIGTNDDQNSDSDFLSSIELLILDQADVYLMQNWEHVLHIFENLHCQPKEAHDMDISRLRLWTANGWNKYYCQTLVFGSLATPEILSLSSKHAHSFEGKMVVHRVEDTGSIRQVVVVVPQVFQRIPCEVAVQQVDARFQFFVEKILPTFNTPLMLQTAIFIPSYFDFVRVRNFLKKEEISFCQISEYTSTSDVKRARAWFNQGRRHFLIFTERFHFYHRYRFKGVRHLLFYQLPMYAEFYPEIVNTLDEGHHSDLTVHVLYSRYDQQALNRVVGGARGSHMTRSEGAVHMLVSGSS